MREGARGAERAKPVVGAPVVKDFVEANNVGDAVFSKIAEVILRGEVRVAVEDMPLRVGVGR